MRTEKLETRRVLLFTGNGKGKTTAAVGMAVRAAGHGLSVMIIQFIKSKSVGELALADHFENIEILQTGKGFVPDKGDPAFEEHRLAAEYGLKKAEEALTSGQYDLVCLDEVVTTVGKGLISENDLINIIRKTAPATDVVMTGRGATGPLIDLADTVTEMRAIKHGFESGLKAKKGVEF